MQKITLIACALLVAGCEVVHAPRGIKNVTAQDVILPSKPMYVAIGPNGTRKTLLNQTEEAEDSGVEAADVVYEQVLHYQSRTVKGAAFETEKQAIESAKAKGMGYVVYTRVNDWTDANYLTCGEKYFDRMSVDIAIYDTESGKAVRLDNLYDGGCPLKIFSIPIGTSSMKGRLEDVFSIWLEENFVDRR